MKRVRRSVTDLGLTDGDDRDRDMWKNCFWVREDHCTLDKYFYEWKSIYLMKIQGQIYGMRSRVCAVNSLLQNFQRQITVNCMKIVNWAPEVVGAPHGVYRRMWISFCSIHWDGCQGKVPVLNLASRREGVRGNGVTAPRTLFLGTSAWSTSHFTNNFRTSLTSIKVVSQGEAILHYDNRLNKLNNNLLISHHWSLGWL